MDELPQFKGQLQMGDIGGGGGKISFYAPVTFEVPNGATQEQLIKMLRSA